MNPFLRLRTEDRRLVTTDLATFFECQHMEKFLPVIFGHYHILRASVKKVPFLFPCCCHNKHI